MTGAGERRGPRSGSPAAVHKWEFRARFRRNGFGWRSQPAVSRVNEAVAEIRKVARRQPILAAEGAVLFLEKVSPAIASVDGSSGAIGNAVNKAVGALAGVISGAVVDPDVRRSWLERLWTAYLEDRVPYIESLGEHWGELCTSPELASEWADRLLGPARQAWSPNSRSYFPGTTACLSSLLAAGRFQEILDLLELDKYPMWCYRRYGVQALEAMGRPAEALLYAEAKKGLNDNPAEVARACERILISLGREEEAYRRYGALAARAGTYLAWFRNLQKAYPDMQPGAILADLVAATPGEEGKWFAAAKDAGLFVEAAVLARISPCAPQTLVRAARDYGDSQPGFAMEVGLAALHWLAAGYGYEVTGSDVADAYRFTMGAAGNAGRTAEARERLEALMKDQVVAGGLVDRVLSQMLGAANRRGEFRDAAEKSSEPGIAGE